MPCAPSRFRRAERTRGEVTTLRVGHALRERSCDLTAGHPEQRGRPRPRQSRHRREPCTRRSAHARCLLRSPALASASPPPGRREGRRLRTRNSEQQLWPFLAPRMAISRKRIRAVQRTGVQPHGPRRHGSAISEHRSAAGRVGCNPELGGDRSHRTRQPDARPRLVALNVDAWLMEEHRFVRLQMRGSGRHDISRTS